MKANGAVIAVINVIIRIANYATRSPPADYPYTTWFNDDDKYLYVFVTLIGALGMPLGRTFFFLRFFHLISLILLFLILAKSKYVLHLHSMIIY